MLPNYKDLDPVTLALIGDSLPERWKEVADLIGIEAFLSFIDEFGGQEIVFPKRENGIAAAHYAQLLEALGRENLSKLQMHFGYGVKMQIPVCVRAQQVLRNRQIIKEFDELLKRMSQPKAVADIVRRYRLTSKQVENIVNGKCKSTATPAE